MEVGSTLFKGNINLWGRSICSVAYEKSIQIKYVSLTGNQETFTVRGRSFELIMDERKPKCGSQGGLCAKQTRFRV